MIGINSEGKGGAILITKQSDNINFENITI